MCGEVEEGREGGALDKAGLFLSLAVCLLMARLTSLSFTVGMCGGGAFFLKEKSLSHNFPQYKKKAISRLAA